MVDLHTIGDNACHNVSFPLRLLPILKFGCGGRDRRGRGRRRDHMMRDVRTCHPLSLSRFAAPRPPDEERSKAERPFGKHRTRTHAHVHSRARSPRRSPRKRKENPRTDDRTRYRSAGAQASRARDSRLCLRGWVGEEGPSFRPASVECVTRQGRTRMIVAFSLRVSERTANIKSEHVN